MARPNFLTELNVASSSVKTLLTGAGQTWLAQIISDGVDRTDPLRTTELDSDRIYELLCYFSMLSGLDSRVTLRCITPTANKNKSFRFPYGPARKQNFAFFRFEFGGGVYDLCCGTAVPASLGTSKEHPDVSLQQVADLDANASPGTLVAIWDAKYHHKGNAAKNDIAQMNMWLDLLTVPPCTTDDVIGELLPKHFQVTAVLTNASKSPQYVPLLLKKCFSVVNGYRGPDTGNDPQPSRAQHLEHRSKLALVPT